jgi:2-aminoadipate transaminase
LKCKDSDGRVIYLTSLSKALAPALRLGVVAASVAQLPAIAEVKPGSDLVCSVLLQRATAEYLRTGGFQAHLDRTRAVYRERRDAMLQALDRHLRECVWTYPAGGLSLWVTLPEDIDERDFTNDAAMEGVSVAAGRVFMTREYQQAHMRLSFGMQPPDRIEEGVAKLGRVLQRHLGRGELTIAGRSIGPLV